MSDYWLGFASCGVILCSIYIAYVIFLKIWENDLKKQRQEERRKLDWSIVDFRNKRMNGYFKSGFVARKKHWDG